MYKDKQSSKSFIESERRSSQQPGPSRPQQHPVRKTSPVQDLIKCFCGTCETFFKRKTIERALISNENEIFHDEELRDILKKFVISERERLKKGLDEIPSQSNFDTPLDEILENFELANDIKNGNNEFDDFRDELEKCCPSAELEECLDNVNNDETKDEFLLKFMAAFVAKFEAEGHHQKFKKALEKKLKL